MELLSEVRPGFGSAVRYYRSPESAWVYWERWEWRAPEPPERRMLLVWWFTPFGVIVGLMTLFIALLGSSRRPDAPRWVHVDAGWCDPYMFEQIRAMSGYGSTAAPPPG